MGFIAILNDSGWYGDENKRVLLRDEELWLPIGTKVLKRRREEDREEGGRSAESSDGHRGRWAPLRGEEDALHGSEGSGVGFNISRDECRAAEFAARCSAAAEQVRREYDRRFFRNHGVPTGSYRDSSERRVPDRSQYRRVRHTVDVEAWCPPTRLRDEYSREEED